MSDKHYLRLLSESYPTAAQVRSRIIRLKAVLSLPKGTEYFSAICTANTARSFIC